MFEKNKIDSKKPSVKINFIYRTFYDILLIITPLITAPYVSRVLGANGIGIYSYTSSIMTFFTMFAALGTASYGMREISQNRDDRKKSSKIFWEIELMTVFTSCVCLLGWGVLSVVYTEYTPYLLALIPTMLGTTFDISWYFTGHEKVSYTVINNSIVKILSLICLFAFVRSKNDLLLYVFLNSFALCLGSLSMWVHLPKMLVKVSFKGLEFKRHLQETMIYFIPTIATSVYTILDKTLIGIITNDNYQNGYYDQAYKIIKLAKTVVFTSVNTVMGARIAYLFAKEKFTEIKNRITRSMSFILLVGYGITFGLIGIAEKFVPVFFGDGYEPVTMMIYMMAPLIIIIGISNCLGSQYFTPSGRRKESAKVIVIGSVINLILNICIIPFFGAQGAIFSSLIAEGFITYVYVRKSNGYMTFKDIFNLSWKRVLAGAVMCFCVMIAGNFFTLSISAVDKTSRILSASLG
ncbi:MAG: oligosaccharide flippase family protein, partial [Ruminococcus sp.]|nr:oligosaccharide flippase family protein [Ruminococcus sp.]